jgi:hypothetical protein
LLARRAVDLRPGIVGVALDVLSALRTGEFEFSHKTFFELAAKRAGLLLVGDETANLFFKKFASPTVRKKHAAFRS